MGLAVGTAILEGNLAVATEISNAYNPKLNFFMATPGKITVSEELCTEVVTRCDINVEKLETT